jgi:hypothetical protein
LPFSRTSRKIKTTIQPLYFIGIGVVSMHFTDNDTDKHKDNSTDKFRDNNTDKVCIANQFATHGAVHMILHVNVHMTAHMNVHVVFGYKVLNCLLFMTSSSITSSELELPLLAPFSQW